MAATGRAPGQFARFGDPAVPDLGRQLGVIGMRPVRSNCARMRQCPKFGNETVACLPMRKRFSSTVL